MTARWSDCGSTKGCKRGVYTVIGHVAEVQSRFGVLQSGTSDDLAEN